MRLHPRERAVRKAQSEAALYLARFFSERGLTDGEIVAFHASELQTVSKYMIRLERHDDEETPGGRA